MTEKMLSIGQIAARTGVAVSALRFYEAQGLIRPGRNAGRQRRYLRADIRRVSFILIAQQFGFTLPQIRAELDRLPAGRTPTKRDWQRIGHHFSRTLDARIATLQAMRDRLDGCIGCGCLSLKACALYNPADRAAGLGSGPRYLLGDEPVAEDF